MDTNIVKELVGEIEYLNDEYRAGNPQVSDEEYDALLAKLASIDPNNYILKRGIIEGQKETDRKRRLPIRMASMNKVKSVEELIAWIYSTLKVSSVSNDIDHVKFVVTPKYNGISLLYDVSYDNVYTRGDGAFGQICTDHFFKMNKNIINNDLSDVSCIVGEAIIPIKIWEEKFKGKLSSSGLPYKLNNATVAGLFNCDEPSDVLDSVVFMKYKTTQDYLDKYEQLDYLNELSTNYKVPYIILNALDFVEHEDILDDFFKECSKDFPIDGLVIDIDSFDLRLELGEESNGNPAYARALKLDKWSEEKDTVITGYDFQISKQGKLKGVVTFDPVLINGTDVKQATFYNARFLRDFFLYPGTKITVKKSGEVIPKIVAVEGVNIPNLSDTSKYENARNSIFNKIGNRLLKENIIVDISNCPSCGEKLIEDENGVELICTNKSCRDKHISKLEHFVLTLGVEEVGRPTIESMYNAGISTCSILYTIEEKMLKGIEGFGDSTIDTIVSQFKKVRENGISLAKLMYALDLFEGKIGEKTAQLIFDSIDVFDEDNRDVAKLCKIKGVSDKTAECFLSALNLIDERTLSYYNVNMIESKQIVPSGTKFVGFSVCFSGLRDKELEKVIIDNGGIIVDGVSKKTTHLIVADPNQNTSKTVKAKELGIKIMTLEQFKQL